MEAQGYQMFFDILELKKALVAGSVALSVINPLGLLNTHQKISTS